MTSFRTEVRAGTGFPTQIIANRSSTIIELADKDGSPQSQNIIRQLSDTMEAYKNQEIKMEKLDNKVTSFLQKYQVSDGDLNNVVETYKEANTTWMKGLDDVVHLIKAFPAMLEGSKGLIEKEIQPLGPLIKKPDWSTLNADMYIYINEAQNRTLELSE